jgi:hypothetical protein
MARFGRANAVAYTTQKESLPAAARGQACTDSTIGALQPASQDAFANAEEHAPIHCESNGFEQRGSLHQARCQVVGARRTEATHHAAPRRSERLDKERPGRGRPGTALGARCFIGRRERDDAPPPCHRDDA